MNMRIPKAALLGLLACLLAGPIATPSFAQDSVGVERLTGTLKKIKDNQAITIGFRDASVPFSYLNSSRRPIGYTIDLCLAIVDAIKEELSLSSIDVKYLPVNPQTRIPLVVDGSVDLECGQTTKNAERQKLVSFSPIMFVSGTKLLVKRSSKLKSYRDLKNRPVAVTEGTTNEAALKSLDAKLGLNMNILPVRENDQAFAAVESGKADAWAGDDAVLYATAAEARNPSGFHGARRIPLLRPLWDRLSEERSRAGRFDQADLRAPRRRIASLRGSTSSGSFANYRRARPWASP